MMLAFVSLLGLILLLTVLLSLAAHYLRPKDSSLVDKINACLPQTQCGQCAYPGCRPYAEAIANNNAPINRCPPGGDHTIQLLAQLLKQPVLPLNTTFGEHKPASIAVIDEAACIGCTLCIAACPVDAIVGAQHFMHSVLSDDCTGCERCITPCPVNCITMQATPDKDIVPPPPLDVQADLPCIQCDLCTDVCPVHLPAQALYHQARHQQYSNLLTQTQECIECGLCEQKCPSKIPLLDYYRWGMAMSNYHNNLEQLAQRNLHLSLTKQARTDAEHKQQDDFWQQQQQHLKQKIVSRHSQC